MKRVIKYMVFGALALLLAGSVTSCVKAWEDEKEEIIRRPQVDIDPDAPGWEDGDKEKIE